MVITGLDAKADSDVLVCIIVFTMSRFTHYWFAVMSIRGCLGFNSYNTEAYFQIHVSRDVHQLLYIVGFYFLFFSFYLDTKLWTFFW